MVENNELFRELITRQVKNIPSNKKLLYHDIKRICKYINTSIFDENNCCIWNGYITNSNNINKGIYINFYFKKKKTALHRLLYSNFVEILKDDEYLKFNCENKGKCCNIHHLKKYSYRKKNKMDTNTKKDLLKKNVIKKDSRNKISSFTLSFD